MKSGNNSRRPRGKTITKWQCTKIPGSSYAEALATGTTGLGVGIGELEAASDKLVRIIENRALEIEGSLGIDDHWNLRRALQDVALARLGGEFHLVAETVATAAGDSDTQESTLVLTGDERTNLRTGGLRQTHELLVTFTHAFGKHGKRRWHHGRNVFGRNRHYGNYCPIRTFIKRRATVTALAKLAPLATPRPAMPKAVP